MEYLQNPISAICLDSSHKPDAIKTCNWVVKDREYHIIATAKMIFTGELAYKLAEIDTECPEYPFYKASRFGVKPEDLENLFKLQQNIDIEELMTEYVEI